MESVGVAPLLALFSVNNSVADLIHSYRFTPINTGVSQIRLYVSLYKYDAHGSFTDRHANQYVKEYPQSVPLQ